jgi:hypothetical protein
MISSGSWRGVLVGVLVAGWFATSAARPQPFPGDWMRCAEEGTEYRWKGALPTSVRAEARDGADGKFATKTLHWKAMQVGKLALMTPVMASVEGRCVARMRGMPAARAFWAMRATQNSTSLPATIIRSANSSMTTTM